MDKKELNQEELDKMLNNACYNCRDQETLELVKSLYKQGANLKKGQYHSDTPLWKAIRNGQIIALEWLLDQGIDMATKDYSVFFEVLCNDRFGSDEFSLILKRDPNVDYIDSKGRGYKDIADEHQRSRITDKYQHVIVNKLKLIEKYKDDKLLNEYHYYIKKSNSGHFITKPFKELKKAAAYYICNEYDKEGFCIVKAKVDCNVSEKITNEINKLIKSMLRDASTYKKLTIEHTTEFNLNDEKIYKIICFDVVSKDEINKSLIS